MSKVPNSTVVRRGKVAVIRVKDLMIAQSDPEELKQRLALVIENVDKPQVVLDMAEVDRISSLMLGVIMALTLRIRRQRGEVRLCNAIPDIQVAFAVVKLDSIIPMDDTLDDALEALEAN